MLGGYHNREEYKTERLWGHNHPQPPISTPNHPNHPNQIPRAVKKVQPVLGGFNKEEYKTERLWGH